MPKVVAVFSGVGHNHIGIVIAWDGTNITIQECNPDGKTNTFQEAKTGWKTKTYTLAQFNSTSVSSILSISYFAYHFFVAKQYYSLFLIVPSGY